jgi:hypothetical protein
MNASLLLEDAYVLTRAFSSGQKSLNDLVTAVGRYKPLAAAYLAICVQDLLASHEAKRFRMELATQTSRK